MVECAKCKKRYGQLIKCENKDCSYVLCLDCDNSSTILMWIDIDDKDYYFCEKCRSNHAKKEIITIKNEIITLS